MAHGQDNYLFEDDFDAVLGIIVSYFLENQEELGSEINQTGEKIPLTQKLLSLKYYLCHKVWLSIGG